jgi:foldase protein PrsA
MSNKIKCSHILVAKQSEAIAILARIKAGEKFGKLAKELSTYRILATHANKIFSVNID